MSVNRTKLNLVVEGQTDLAVLTKILHSMDIREIGTYVKSGKGELLKKLRDYNRAAQRGRWLIVLDLDQDADCAPNYVNSILPTPASGMELRIAVRSIEAWLMADRGRMRSF